MSGSVVVLAGSGKTGNDSRDKKMNKDILKVEQHATVSFEPKSYTRRHRSIRGLDHPGNWYLHPAGHASRNHYPHAGAS